MDRNTNSLGKKWKVDAFLGSANFRFIEIVQPCSLIDPISVLLTVFFLL